MRKKVCHLTFLHLFFLDLSLVVIHSFSIGLEPVLDNVGEPTVSRSTDRLTWDKPVPGDPSQTANGR